MSAAEYDVVVVGGGTAGIVAATRCASFGLRVAMVERDRLGGECLWTGCVPAKAMLSSAEVQHLMRRAAEYGLRPCLQPLEWARVIKAKDDVVNTIAEQDTPVSLRRAGVDVLFGTAAFLSPWELAVDGKAVRARNFVLSTGSRQAEPRQIPGLAEAGYITHVEAVNLKSLPDSILIIGGGPVGIEFAQIFARLGAKSIVLDRSETILAREDPQVAHYLQRLLREEGVEILVRATAGKVSRRQERKVVTVVQNGAGREVEVDEVMLATGRAPNIEELRIEGIGLRRGPWGLEVDEHLRTNLPHIYACGDVTGKFLFSHVAEYQARIAAHNIAFPEDPRRADYRVVPWATFTEPEVAHLGLTEPEAREAGYDVGVECFPFSRLDRALVIRKSEGLVKVIGDNQTGEIVGAHIVGPGAGNIIHEYAVAMKAHLPLSEVAETIHAYPTLSEALKLAATQFEEEREDEIA